MTAPIMAARGITMDLREDYQRDGYAMVRGLYSADEMARWKTAITESLGTDVHVHVWLVEDIPDLFRDAFSGPAIVTAVKSILGPNIEFLSAKPVIKSGASRTASPWHQDRPYWGGGEKISAWIAMDPATPANGCLRVVKGGHRVALQHVTPPAEDFGNRLREEDLPEGEIVDCVMEPGDTLFFSDLLPHSSYENPDGIPRWSMIPTYRNADEPDISQLWASSLPL